MEQGSREDTGAARSQNVVHVTTRDAAGAARLLAPAVARHEGTAGQPAVLIVTPSAADAVAIARALAVAGPSRAVPLTSAPRARRLLAQQPNAIIASVDLGASLIEQSQLKLSSIAAVVVAWADELLSAGALSSLEAILAEVPRGAERIVLATSVNADLDAFLDRVMWRARRVTHFTESAPADVPLRFVVTPPERRDDALRLVLDALDPKEAAISTFSDEGERAARRALETLGYAADDATVRLSRGAPDQPADLVVLFDDAADADQLRASAAQARDLVVFVPAERVPHLRVISGASSRPLTFSGAFAAARSAADALRDEIQDAVRSGAHVAQMPVLEPLAVSLDPVEVAAAAVTLLLRERQRGRGGEVVAATPAPRVAGNATLGRSGTDATRGPATPQRFTRVFLSVGERDGVRRGDLVGAIAGEGGIAGSQIGKIELRDSHAIVEIESDVAAEVIGRVNGTNIRGKRVSAREDRGPDVEGSGGRGRGARGDRPARGGAAGRGSTGRGERGPAGRGTRERPPRGEGRPARGRDRDFGRGEAREIERVPRAAKESAEWTERAARLRNARRAPGGAGTEGEA